VLRLWRLTRADRTALDGAGTFEHGGRYSPPGAPVVNFASEAGLAVLVALRYEPDENDDYVLGWTEIDATPERAPDVDDEAVVRAWVSEWLREERSLIAAVRSRVLPEADVVLMNVRHPDAARVPPLVTRPFSFSETLHTPPMLARYPTSHERLSGQPWDASYRDGLAPWDIERPQPAIMQLAFGGDVLDVGCGTGESTLYIASLGLPVVGVDVAETALSTARAKAAERGLDAEFAAADALQLERLGRTFDTVLDCALFHTFDGEERPRYAASLASVTRPGAVLYVLCFSDEGDELGPHPVGEQELRTAFAGGEWTIEALVPERLETRFHPDGAPAWLATIRRA
jgi:SAM-dependent methyltransferase/RES domain-containing protein